MANFFFDVLPAEIRQEIYGICLSDALMRNYYRRVAQKVALTQLVLKIQAHSPQTTYNAVGYYGYNPKNNTVRYVMEKCSKVITKSDDRDWWISNLIKPVERGLFFHANLDEHGQPGYPVNENYVRTEYAYHRLIDILGWKGNKNRYTWKL